ncbi:MAG: type II toxin-antitoxin system RelE/ParE family toxin [Reichenbachiella sp.]|uniref:type II toxin-antitoxin system RelE/ParE family toxin n=1 Tax=Reichenbachiella sp. TaxID=2184521 RepID=UPI0032652038
MNYELIIKPAAEQDLIEIAQWYESQSAGLGKRFLEAIEVKVLFIESNPELYQKRYKEVRFALVKRFPYAIHYTIESQKVYVHAVLSTYKDSIVWKERNP